MIRVFHAKILKDFKSELAFTIGFRPTPEAIKEMIDAGDMKYIEVARIETDDFERAWMLTNSIDTAWYETRDDSVTKLFEGRGCRSTSVGDLMVRDDGKGRLVVNIGYTDVPTWSAWIDKK